MKYFKWLDKRVAKLQWCDIAMIKIAAAAMALFIAKVWPPLLSLDWYWYLVIAVIFGYIPGYKFFCKR